MPMSENDKPEKPDHSIAAQQAKGLQRLQAAVQAARIEHPREQKPATAERWAALCRLWTPLDTYQSFAARHPEWGHIDQLHSRMLRIRARVPGLPKSISLGPWQIAMAYLDSIPEHYRRESES